MGRLEQVVHAVLGCELIDVVQRVGELDRELPIGLEQHGHQTGVVDAPVVEIDRSSGQVRLVGHEQGQQPILVDLPQGGDIGEASWVQCAHDGGGSGSGSCSGAEPCVST